MIINTLYIVSSFIVSLVLAQKNESNKSIIANGQMPDITTDKNQNVHIVYGSGDSIMYLTSKDGKSFSRPFLVSVLPKLFASGMRGPQIAAAVNGLVITACTKDRNIYSFKQEISGKWTKLKRLNNIKETAKEALMDLSADGLHVNAVWLGISQRGQAVYGARSADRGKTWIENKLVYASPDSTVCECCKPSVAVKGNSVYVMFRNWINGNRDLYLIRSVNGGSSFGRAQKLGNGSWKLNGCLMDGGGLVISKSG
jgi:hypothetical protein